MIRLSSHLHLRHYIHLHSELEVKPCIVLPLHLSHGEIDFHMGGTSSTPSSALHHLHGPQATCSGGEVRLFFCWACRNRRRKVGGWGRCPMHWARTASAAAHSRRCWAHLCCRTWCKAEYLMGRAGDHSGAPLFDHPMIIFQENYPVANVICRDLHYPWGFAQRGCGVSFYRDIQEPSEYLPVWPTVGYLLLQEVGLDDLLRSLPTPAILSSCDWLWFLRGLSSTQAQHTNPPNPTELCSESSALMSVISSFSCHSNLKPRSLGTEIIYSMDLDGWLMRELYTSRFLYRYVHTDTHLQWCHV